MPCMHACTPCKLVPLKHARPVQFLLPHVHAERGLPHPIASLLVHVANTVPRLRAAAPHAALVVLLAEGAMTSC